MDESRIKILLSELDKYPILFAYLFGSQVNDKTTKLSDIDLAVFIDKKISKSERFDIRLRLTNSLSAVAGKRVDVTVMNDIPIQLAYEVIKHGKVILCRDRDTMVNTEVEILSKYLDRRYYDKRRAEISLKK
ncbi:MAG: type VII toxin-antitoxin system MntA family adenylyltransferase antitoxin [Thermodesulfovibrionales bacterium]